jgi:hypothetical protein
MDIIKSNLMAIEKYYGKNKKVALEHFHLEKNVLKLTYFIDNFVVDFNSSSLL